MPLLSATNLSKSFGALDIFSELSFSIPHRSRIGLVGPNGVGKSTLLRILIGEDEASGGLVNRARTHVLASRSHDAIRPLPVG
jgi:ATP-binding cassette subfamily F protein 3